MGIEKARGQSFANGIKMKTIEEKFEFELDGILYRITPIDSSHYDMTWVGKDGAKSVTVRETYDYECEFNIAMFEAYEARKKPSKTLYGKDGKITLDGLTLSNSVKDSIKEIASEYLKENQVDIRHVQSVLMDAAHRAILEIIVCGVH